MVHVLFLKMLLICLNESCELEVTSVVNWTGVGGVWYHVVRYLNMQDVYANITLLWSFGKPLLTGKSNMNWSKHQPG
jgi:hypothetical protein